MDVPACAELLDRAPRLHLVRPDGPGASFAVLPNAWALLGLQSGPGDARTAWMPLSGLPEAVRILSEAGFLCAPLLPQDMDGKLEFALMAALPDGLDGAPRFRLGDGLRQWVDRLSGAAPAEMTDELPSAGPIMGA